MIIILSPVRADSELEVSTKGEVVTANGEVIDLSNIGEGVEKKRAMGYTGNFISAIRENGELTVTLMFPHGPFADDAARFPVPIKVARDGQVALPPNGHESLKEGMAQELSIDPG